MLCKELMNKNIYTINEDTKIYEVCKILSDKNINILPIVNNDKVIGVITLRDIISKVCAMNKSLDDIVKNYMTLDFIYVYENEDITIAISKMADYQIKRIIIVNNSKKVVGIISIKDIALNNQTNRYLNTLLKEINYPTPNVIKPIKYLVTDDKAI